MDKSWLHDPSVILSSSVLYDVIYLGSVNARNSGDKNDAQRALGGKFYLSFLPLSSKLESLRGKRHHATIRVNCRQFSISANHSEIYAAPLYTVRYFALFYSFLSLLSYTIALENNTLLCVKEEDSRFRYDV